MKLQKQFNFYNIVKSLVLFFLVTSLSAAVAADSDREKAVEKLREKVKKTEEEQKLQNQILRREVIDFVRDNADRETGAGWLYLARHYLELDQPERSLMYLRTLLRSDHIQSDLISEARLLRAEILFDLEEYDQALRELDRLIESEPEREFLVRAKIERASILGRKLTGVEELVEAFKGYYWHFPEQFDMEAVDYIVGFQRGYDLEIAMQALVAWEEISKFPEKESANLANLRIALLYAFDLNNPQRAIEYIDKTQIDESYPDLAFVKAILHHLYLKNGFPETAIGLYSHYRKQTDSLDGYRIATILQSRLLHERIKDDDAAVQALEGIFATPPHLVATESIYLERRREIKAEEADWAILAMRMAGYICEYGMGNLDRARSFYQKASQTNKDREEPRDEFWISTALKRTEPAATPAQILFDMAYEKSRSRATREALNLYEEFIEKYPGHELFREALYRTALITDYDLREYEKALEMYQRYLIKFAPVKSSWNLDVLYDWGRIDEVRYRIGSLLALHLIRPVAALDEFEQLAKIYPESYWAQQGLKDSIAIYRDDLGDTNKANELMQKFIDMYPESKDASDYRLILYRIYLQKNEQIKALTILRDYLDHSLPSDKDFFDMKQQWRDLSFRIREERLRERLEISGHRDRVDIYNNLIDVLCLASSSAPLEALVTEVKGAEIEDQLRWGLVYNAASRMYIVWPDKATPLFTELEATASGTARLACLLTLGNIAYRVDKNVQRSIINYEKALSLLPLTDPLAEQPLYRLGRLYLTDGRGIKGLETLQRFTARFSASKYLSRAFMAMGDACVALNTPERAVRFYRRIIRIAPEMAEKVQSKITEAISQKTSKEWLAERAIQIREDLRGAAEGDQAAVTAAATARQTLGRSHEITEEELPELEPLSLYSLFLEENQRQRPDFDKMVMFLYELLRRTDISPTLREKAVRHYISCRFFRRPAAEKIEEEIQQLLSRHNYAPWQSELLFRLAQAQDHYLKERVDANRSYFEYLSFYPDGKRAKQVQQRIPLVYVELDDLDNAYRFFERFIDDRSVPDKDRVDAAMQLALVQIRDDKSDEAAITLESVLTLESERRPEICLRLERLTENFEYVRRALEAKGDEDFRFRALNRLIAKAEEDEDYAQASLLLEEFADSFELPRSVVWIDRKLEELSKRGTIGEIEYMIDTFPEEPETPSRMFRLAKMVEGTENTKYRAQDLFYEITLVYPRSEFFRESKIRAENVRTIAAIAELTDILQMGTTGPKSEEALIERARLLKENLQDISGAIENYETFIQLFPHSSRLDEVYLNLGDLMLAETADATKAFDYWEKGLSTSLDPFMRDDLTRRINGLKSFREKILFSENDDDNEDAVRQIFKIWKVSVDRAFALGMLNNALDEISNRPIRARLHYYAGRIHEESENFDAAITAYEKALRSLYHPGCRKDMLFYRMARINARRNRLADAERNYLALIRRYPRSLLTRSAYYWLYKLEESRKNLTLAHHYLERLLASRALYPVHRRELNARLKQLEALMNVADLTRLQKLSTTGGGQLPYFVGKVLEYDLRDYEKAIKQYEEFLRSGPPVRQSRELLEHISELHEKMGDYVQAVAALDRLLDTFEPSSLDFDLIVRMGSLVEDKLNNPELTVIFYESIASNYHRIRPVREFALGKLRWIEDQKRAAARKPKSRKVVRRVYSEYDDDVVAELEEIIAYHVDELQDFRMAERHMEDLWNEFTDSLATLDIMEALVELNMKHLIDPQKAGMYYERWLEENPDDPLYKEYTMKLYDHYMEVMRDGQKALRLLEDFIRANPISIETLDIELKLAITNEVLVRNFDEARRIYERIIDTRQNDPVIHEAYFRLGHVLREGYADYDAAIKLWQELINNYYNNEFSDRAQYAIGYTYEAFVRDFTLARQNYERLLNLFPNSSLQSQTRDALLRVEGK